MHKKHNLMQHGVHKPRQQRPNSVTPASVSRVQHQVPTAVVRRLSYSDTVVGSIHPHERLKIWSALENRLGPALAISRVAIGEVPILVRVTFEQLECPVSSALLVGCHRRPAVRSDAVVFTHFESAAFRLVKKLAAVRIALAPEREEVAPDARVVVQPETIPRALNVIARVQRGRWFAVAYFGLAMYGKDVFRPLVGLHVV